MTLTQLRYAIAVSDSRSMNEAAHNLFISQPSLSAAIKDLEEEIGTELFTRNSRGISITPEGEEFIGYARQVTDQYSLIESRYIEKKNIKKKFSISTQHYSFAVDAFVKMVEHYGMDDYEFAVRESRTAEVIEDVSSLRSEIGILYVNDFNRKVMQKLFRDSGLEFHDLVDCRVYAYVWSRHPLAGKESVTIEELQDYPCLSFDQGVNNSFYFAEEVLSTYEYRQGVKVNDRATMLNLMVGLNGYTLCSGIICGELNGSDYVAVPLASEEIMTIGYITRKGIQLSSLGELYLEKVREYLNAGDDN